MTLLNRHLIVYRQTKDTNLMSSTILLYSYALSHPMFSFHKRNYPCWRFNGSHKTLVWERRCSLDAILIRRCSGMPILNRFAISCRSTMRRKSIDNYLSIIYVFMERSGAYGG